MVFGLDHSGSQPFNYEHNYCVSFFTLHATVYTERVMHQPHPVGSLPLAQNA